ncbi:hypothetical protein C5E06_04615 [Pseudoclavibacter sp. RFBI5]|uniref:DUF6361 family protein n=1 Tax=Pseudoclavibacter sp. RFBI5 TaxID=2080578 RepID=UPI000CE79011|nr:DUF6361 family protein [Pseudoclavibacter sp. RFBI5]PPG04450.1 hypothetical protein C5E06_04615 [Pseudoclavibacter sp. RFBI5]
MPSLVAWLDASSEEQRRMRDIIGLFTDRESRDELGLSAIRDPLGDMLFPGTSVLHTRARYLLLVPWVYARASTHGNPAAEADNLERTLIGAIRKTDDNSGLIGMTAGAAVRTLPSSMYWGLLGRLQIRTDPSASRADTLAEHLAANGGGDLDEAGTQHSAWHTSIPKPPPGFPKELPGGFALRRGEAEWLRERILTTTPGTLLAHLTQDGPGEDSRAPWEDPAVLRAPGDAGAVLEDARAFSAVVHGAQLLYNLILAEAYEAAGYDAVTNPVDHYRQRLTAWATRLPEHVDLKTWNVDGLIHRVELQRGQMVPARTRRFVTAWTALLRHSTLNDLADNGEARALVTRSERESKGAQARIGDSKRLVNWSGGSGAGALAYRWNSVRRMLVDLHAGLNTQTGANDA